MEPALNQARSWCCKVRDNPRGSRHRIEETDGGPLSVPEVRFSHVQGTPSIGSEPSGDTEEVSTRRVQYIQYSTNRKRVAQTTRPRGRLSLFQPFSSPFPPGNSAPTGRPSGSTLRRQRGTALGKGRATRNSGISLLSLSSHRRDKSLSTEKVVE